MALVKVMPVGSESPHRKQSRRRWRTPKGIDGGGQYGGPLVQALSAGVAQRRLIVADLKIGLAERPVAKRCADEAADNIGSGNPELCP